MKVVVDGLTNTECLNNYSLVFALKLGPNPFCLHLRYSVTLHIRTGIRECVCARYFIYFILIRCNLQPVKVANYYTQSLLSS